MSDYNWGTVDPRVKPAKEIPKTESSIEEFYAGSFNDHVQALNETFREAKSHEANSTRVSLGSISDRLSQAPHKKNPPNIFDDLIVLRTQAMEQLMGLIEHPSPEISEWAMAQSQADLAVIQSLYQAKRLSKNPPPQNGG